MSVSLNAKLQPMQEGLCPLMLLRLAFLSEGTRLCWRIKPLPFHRSKVLRGMKRAVSILEMLDWLKGGRELSESLNEYVMQHQL